MSVQTIWVADHIMLTTGPHDHDFYQFLFCVSGDGEIVVDGVTYPAVAGSAFLVPPMMMHSFRQIECLRLYEIKFFVTNEKFARSMERIPIQFMLGDHDPQRNTLECVIREGLGSSVYNREATDAQLMLLLIGLIRSRTQVSGSTSRYLGRDERADEGMPIGEKDTDFLRVIDYIEKHLSEQITLDDLTNVAHFDKSYLIVRFKEKYGIPPMKYVNWLRIERAKVLLSVTEKSITEISSEVGFGSVHYFSRFFKEKEDISPNEYRAARQKT